MAVETQEYRAEARFQRVSPQKARLVLDLVKGLGVQQALETLQFTKKRIAPIVHKLLTEAAREELGLIEDIEEGIADADAGRVISHEELTARLEDLFPDRADSKAA